MFLKTNKISDAKTKEKEKFATRSSWKIHDSDAINRLFLKKRCTPSFVSTIIHHQQPWLATASSQSTINIPDDPFSMGSCSWVVGRIWLFGCKIYTPQPSKLWSLWPTAKPVFGVLWTHAGANESTVRSPKDFRTEQKLSHGRPIP